MTAMLALAWAAAIAWLVLLLGRGMFWLARDDDRDAARLPAPAQGTRTKQRAGAAGSVGVKSHKGVAAVGEVALMVCGPF